MVMESRAMRAVVLRSTMMTEIESMRITVPNDTTHDYRLSIVTLN